MDSKTGLLVYPEKCRGCRRCEMACSWKPEGLTNPRMAGIKIYKLEDQGKDLPVFNQTCLDQFCGKEHPGKTGSGIPICVSTCIFGALAMEGVENHE